MRACPAFEPNVYVEVENERVINLRRIEIPELEDVGMPEKSVKSDVTIKKLKTNLKYWEDRRSAHAEKLEELKSRKFDATVELRSAIDLGQSIDPAKYNEACKALGTYQRDYDDNATIGMIVSYLNVIKDIESAVPESEPSQVPETEVALPTVSAEEKSIKDIENFGFLSQTDQTLFALQLDCKGEWASSLMVTEVFEKVQEGLKYQQVANALSALAIKFELAEKRKPTKEELDESNTFTRVRYLYRITEKGKKVFAQLLEKLA